jgi:hypothetical protein
MKLGEEDGDEEEENACDEKLSSIALLPSSTHTTGPF